MRHDNIYSIQPTFIQNLGKFVNSKIYVKKRNVLVVFCSIIFPSLAASICFNKKKKYITL